MRFLVLLAGVSTLLSTVPAEACLVVTGSPPPQGPVFIFRDADFTTNPAVAGGSGTALDPYRIEDLTIPVQGGSGVRISGTNAHFVLRNITVVDSGAAGTRYSSCCAAGIDLSSLENGSIVASTTRGTQQGISLNSVRDVSIADSRVEGSPAGILIRDSQRVALTGNRLTNSSLNLEARTPEAAGSQSIREDNQVDGLPVFYRGDCAGVNVNNRALGALILGNCTGIAVQNVTLAQPIRALELLFTAGATLDNVRGSMFSFWHANQTSLTRSEFGGLTLDTFTEFRLEASRSPPGGSTWIGTQGGAGLSIEGNDFTGAASGAIIELGGYFASNWCSCMGPAPPVSVTGAVVTGNTLHDTGDTAVRVVDAPGAVITGNQMLNVSAGVYSGPQIQVVIEENRIAGGGYGPGISAGGAGSSIRNNTAGGFAVGIEGFGKGDVQVAGNMITSSQAGIEIEGEGHFSVADNRMQGGSVYNNGVSSWSPQDWHLNANNTVNGLPIAFHRGCANLTYEGAVLGELIVVDCQNVTLTNLSFQDISFPLLLAGVMNFTVDNLSVDNASLGIAFRSVYLGRVTHARLNRTDGMAVGDAMNVSFESNSLTNGTAGFRLTSAAGLEFRNNRVETQGEPALSLYEAYELTLRENAFVGGGLAVYGTTVEEFDSHDIDESNTVDGRPLVYLHGLAGVTIEDRSVGQLILANCTNVEFRNLRMPATAGGLTLAFVSDARLTNVTVASAVVPALFAREVERLTIVDSAFSTASDAPLDSSPTAVAMTIVEGVTLERVVVDSTAYGGLDVQGGSGLSIQGGSFTGGYYGVDIGSLAAVTVDNATFAGAYGGISGRSLANASFANSRFLGGGGLGLQNVRDTRVVGNDFQGQNYTGISLDQGTNVDIRGNQVRGGSVGIALFGELQGVTVEANTVAGNGEGLHLDPGSFPGAPSGLRVFDNTIENNAIGVRGNASAGVEVYHNRFLNNTVQALVSPGALWDAGYLVGGNFWSDYLGTDACSGKNQDKCPDPDQFGDTPYCLGAPSGVAEALDRYPLMNQTPPPARDPPPVVPTAPAAPVPGVLDPTVAGLSGIVLILALVGTAALLAAHARARRKVDEEEEAERDGP